MVSWMRRAVDGSRLITPRTSAQGAPLLPGRQAEQLSRGPHRRRRPDHAAAPRGHPCGSRRCCCCCGRRPCKCPAASADGGRPSCCSGRRERRSGPCAPAGSRSATAARCEAGHNGESPVQIPVFSLTPLTRWIDKLVPLFRRTSTRRSSSLSSGRAPTRRASSTRAKARSSGPSTASRWWTRRARAATSPRDARATPARSRSAARGRTPTHATATGTASSSSERFLKIQQRHVIQLLSTTVSRYFPIHAVTHVHCRGSWPTTPSSSSTLSSWSSRRAALSRAAVPSTRATWSRYRLPPWARRWGSCWPPGTGRTTRSSSRTRR